MLLPNEYGSGSTICHRRFQECILSKVFQNYRLDYYKFMNDLKEVGRNDNDNKLPSKHELTFANDGHDGLFDGDENLLISHEPGSYTKLNQFS
jgi:hypothetical protein